jgi:hypothetical protein
MPCVCATCLRHFRTLGLEKEPDSKPALHNAYRRAAKKWHPDRFEREPEKRREAEELFKQVQLAYRELLEHLKAPIEWPKVPEPFVTARRTEKRPEISFGGAPGCFVSPDFSMQAFATIMSLGQEDNQVLAMVDLSGTVLPKGGFSRYLLLTAHGIFVRDKRNIVSLLWYKDLGDVKLVFRFNRRWSTAWEKLIAMIYEPQPRLRLEIHRRNGGKFFTIASEADDHVKKVICSFLQQTKAQMQQ